MQQASGGVVSAQILTAVAQSVSETPPALTIEKQALIVSVPSPAVPCVATYVKSASPELSVLRCTGCSGVRARRDREADRPAADGRPGGDGGCDHVRLTGRASSFVAVAGLSEISRTLMVSHAVVEDGVSEKTSCPVAVAQIVISRRKAGDREAVVDATGPSAGVDGDVARPRRRSPSTATSTLSRTDPMRFGIRSGRSFGSVTAVQVPPPRAMSFRLTSTPPLHDDPLPIANVLDTTPRSVRVVNDPLPLPPSFWIPSDRKMRNLWVPASACWKYPTATSSPAAKFVPLPGASPPSAVANPGSVSAPRPKSE